MYFFPVERSMPVQQALRGAVPEFNQTSAKKRCGPVGCWQNRKVGEACGNFSELRTRTLK
jgi:hypothetical protein